MPKIECSDADGQVSRYTAMHDIDQIVGGGERLRRWLPGSCGWIEQRH